MTQTLTIGFVLFNGTTTLDVFGPATMLGVPTLIGAEIDFDLCFVAETAGPVTTQEGAQILATSSFAEAPDYDVLLVPGGIGVDDDLVQHDPLLDFVRAQAAQATYVTSVCTGAAILACAGVLDGHRATTNKHRYDWVTKLRSEVDWVHHARWVEDGRLFTSSGVSAGIDMALAFMAQVCGRDVAETTARLSEYVWDDDPSKDPFAGS